MIEINSVSKKFGSFWAVQNLTLKIPEKSLFGLLGPNGCGKSTTLRMIASAIRPDDGEILFDGQPVGEVKQNIGYVPQFGGFYENLTVEENVHFFADLYGASGKNAEACMELFGLERGKVSRYLSGGNKRLLALACAMVHDPKYLILDEPEAGIDASVRQMLWTTLTNLVINGKTIVMATHMLSEAHNFTELGLMKEGSLFLKGSPESLLANYDYPVYDILTLQPEKVEQLISKLEYIKWWGRAGRVIRIIMGKEKQEDVELILRREKIQFKLSQTKFNLNDFFIFKFGGAKRK